MNMTTALEINELEAMPFETDELAAHDEAMALAATSSSCSCSSCCSCSTSSCCSTSTSTSSCG